MEAARRQLVLAACLLAFTFSLYGATPTEDLKAALAELGALQERISLERKPMALEVSDLEQRISDRKKELRLVQTLQAKGRNELLSLKADLESSREQSDFIQRNLQDYALYFETRVHVSEVSQFSEVIKDAKVSGKNMELLEAAVERIENQLGGHRFDGKALAANGTLTEGQFLQVGPVVWFASTDKTVVGQAKLEVNSLEPVIVSPGLAHEPHLQLLVSTGVGAMPLDVSGGKAFLIEDTEDSLFEHIQKGGFVMIPILLLAVGSLLVALWKWVEMLRMRAASVPLVQSVVEQVNLGNREQALELATTLNGPVGRMLQAGIEHSNRSSELLEEILYEQVVKERPRLERRLPFIQLAAAIAPLLGLLGTVTGMIHTFKMIIVFGTGDAKTLSTGISEALITTEFGLVVAVAALLIHAFLSRRVKSVLASMEHVAISFVNGLNIGKEAGLKP
ncbi:MotA/TolQ/ExbB proton channel family protein [Verrucomicrobia bacterium]|nr:MotA/TolQ/ExbB proton channel family protein [Verrucomicrobiota bacterium]